MTTLCIKTLVKSDSAIKSDFPWNRNEVGGFATSIYEAMPENLLLTDFPAIILPTANHKDFSLSLKITIRESLISPSHQSPVTNLPERILP